MGDETGKKNPNRDSPTKENRIPIRIFYFRFGFSGQALRSDRENQLVKRGIPIRIFYFRFGFSGLREGLTGKTKPEIKFPNRDSLFHQVDFARSDHSLKPENQTGKINS